MRIKRMRTRTRITRLAIKGIRTHIKRIDQPMRTGASTVVRSHLSTSAPGLGSPRFALYRDWAHPASHCHLTAAKPWKSAHPLRAAVR